MPRASAFPRLRTSPILVFACVALTIAVIVLTALLTTRTARLETLTSREHDVREVSREFAVTILSYDYTNLEASRQHVLALSTTKFGRQYERQWPQLSAALTQQQARSQGRVVDVYLGEIDADTATAIVVTDAISEGKGGPRQTKGSHIRLDLIRVGDQWKVDAASSLDIGTQIGPSTTTTAATRRTTRR